MDAAGQIEKKASMCADGKYLTTLRKARAAGELEERPGLEAQILNRAPKASEYMNSLPLPK